MRKTYFGIQGILNNLQEGNIIFGRQDRLKRKVSGGNGELRPYAHLKSIHAKTEGKYLEKKVDQAIKRLIRADKGINFNSVSEESGRL